MNENKFSQHAMGVEISKAWFAKSCNVEHLFLKLRSDVSPQGTCLRTQYNEILIE